MEGQKSEKIMKVIFVLILGWFIGYMHHFVATQRVWKNLSAQITALGTEIAELKEIVGPLRQARKVSTKVTAYSNDPISIDVPEWRTGTTATGTVAARGTVAADWNLFKPGMRFFIPGYGFGVVTDRGGKVKGYHLDVFFDTREEAVHWGVKKLEVFAF